MSYSQPKPQTHAFRILATLRDHPAGVSDAELARLLDMRHQAVNSECRRLEALGFLTRDSRLRPIINRALAPDDGPSSIMPPRPEEVLIHRDVAPSVLSPPPVLPQRPWSWEGNVQATIVRFLRHEGWTILREANTATRESGHDIEAKRDSVTLWVSVKGTPVRTQKTQAPTQARHWFAGALFDVVLWRREAPENVRFAIALPHYPTYQRLAARTRWLETAVPFDYLWVTEASTVITEMD